MSRLTDSEMRVLRCAIESGDQNYQPSETALATANHLYRGGLLQAAVDFPAVTVATDAGFQGYYDELEARAAEAEQA